MFKSLIKPINNAVRSSTSNRLATVQFAQYHRKARWVPQAKSKIFRVPERQEQNEDERAELMRLHNIYKTQVRAVRSYIVQEVKLKEATSTADHIIVTPEEKAAEMQQCNDFNNAWNASIAEIRNQRLEKARTERQESIVRGLELQEERDRNRRRTAEEMVRLEKERSKTYILLENLDQAIEHALAHPVDYNFAINLEGEILNGRVTSDDKENKSMADTN